jgi:Recombination endonuclease VII
MPYKDPEKRRESQRARTQRYYAAHRDEVLEKQHETRSTPEYRQKSNAQQNRWRAANADRKRAYERAYYQANRRTPEENFHLHLWTRHRLRPEDYEALLAAQEGRCCYCQRPRPENPREVHIDHDHTCTCGPKHSCPACRRGVACQKCNHVVGHADDDPARLEVIAANLTKLAAGARQRIAGKHVQGTLPLDELEVRRSGRAMNPPAVSEQPGSGVPGQVSGHRQ